MVEASKGLPAWHKAITTTAPPQPEPIDVPIKVTARFFMPKPNKPMFDTPATAPDLDKLCRAVGDGLEQAGVIKNDSRITTWVASKHFGTPTGVHIIIEEDQ